MLLATSDSARAFRNATGIRPDSGRTLFAHCVTDQRARGCTVHHRARYDTQGKAILPSKAPRMMKKRIPALRSEREEARFWDSHDSTEYLGDLQEDRETVFVRPENGLIQLGARTWRLVLAEAKRRKTTPARLVDSCI